MYVKYVNSNEYFAQEIDLFARCVYNSYFYRDKKGENDYEFSIIGVEEDVLKALKTKILNESRRPKLSEQQKVSYKVYWDLTKMKQARIVMNQAKDKDYDIVAQEFNKFT